MANRVERLSAAARRLGPVKLGALALGVLVLLYALWSLTSGSDTAAGGAATEQSLVVERRPFTATINFAGTIVPGDAIDVTAPFDGTVKAIGFTYGDRVDAGQVLVELDVSELAQSRNEAESAFLKASQSSTEMQSWTTGPDVSRARRAAASAAFDLADTERKIAETRALLDRGLVPRSEYDGLLQQQRTQRMSATAAHEELGAALRRGGGANQRVAALDLANARGRLGRLNGEFENAVMLARAPGIIVRPPAGKGDGGTDALHVGMRLGKGQLIGSIARAGGLAVSFQLDEADVNQLKPGQAVTVAGPGFGGVVLTGRIHSVAGEAVATASSNGTKPGFTAVARLDPLAEEQAAMVRIGMSAAISVITYSSPAALIVPPEAVQGAAPAATVQVRDRRTGTPRAVPVQLGRVAPEGVEIKSGLRPGDTIVWSVAAPPPTSDAPAP